MPDDLIALIKDRGIVGSMLVSTITGEAWSKHQKAREDLGDHPKPAIEDHFKTGQR